jgi:hypothetical protein
MQEPVTTIILAPEDNQTRNTAHYADTRQQQNGDDAAES